MPGVKKNRIDIEMRLNAHHLEAKNSQKLRFLKFGCVLTKTGRPFLAKIRKNHFFPNYIHKTELHLRAERKLKIFFQSVTIIAHGPLTGIAFSNTTYLNIIWRISYSGIPYTRC